MAAPMKIHSVDEVRRWYEEGMTYKEMAELHKEKYGIRVAPTSFSALRRRMGWPGRLAGDDPLMPWRVAKEHRNSYTYGLLRREIRRRQGLEQISSRPVEELDAWIDSLKERGAVIDYRADTEQGFFLTYARPGIDNDLIREPVED